jgi:hypothetical protein
VRVRNPDGTESQVPLHKLMMKEGMQKILFAYAEWNKLLCFETWRDELNVPEEFFMAQYGEEKAEKLNTKGFRHSKSRASAGCYKDALFYDLMEPNIPSNDEVVEVQWGETTGITGHFYVNSQWMLEVTKQQSVHSAGGKQLSKLMDIPLHRCVEQKGGESLVKLYLEQNGLYHIEGIRQAMRLSDHHYHDGKKDKSRSIDGHHHNKNGGN